MSQIHIAICFIMGDRKYSVDFIIKEFGGKCNMYGIVYYIFIEDNIYLTTQTTLYIGPHLS